jgi:hypothetical protein
MPYIKQGDRARLSNCPCDIKTAGELNYMITLLIKDYMSEHGLSYQVCNDIVGALDGAKVEFQRRIVAPYEDKKIKVNGDVYE